MKLIKLAFFLVILTVSCQTNTSATIEEDRQELTTLLTEIKEIANSVSCTNSSDWNFTAIGSKACGGPQNYIAYHKNIDTVAFLKKVEIYTTLEKTFNKKWGIISDCAVVIAPIDIICENGEVKFVN